MSGEFVEAAGAIDGWRALRAFYVSMIGDAKINALVEAARLPASCFNHGLLQRGNRREDIYPASDHQESVSVGSS
ncbi:MAG: hypothetical protein MUO87_05835 [Thermoplasmata archaeon]|nr:hypothetical protein [Thermoplasmata archaeon]